MTQGVGQALVFLHGWATDKTVWRYQREYFHKEYNVVMLDLRGYGFSEWRPAEDLLSAMADDVAGFLESRGIGQSTIIGWSLGGQVALRLTVTRPELVKSLVLVSTTPKFVSDKEFFSGLPVVSVKRLALDVKRDTKKAISDFYRRLFSPAEAKEKNFRQAYGILKQCVLPSEAAALAGLHVLKTTDLRQDLNKVKAPTLVIHGRNDIICPVGAAEYMASMISDSQLKLLNQAGHCPHLTRTEEFNHYLENFLQHTTKE